MKSCISLQRIRFTGLTRDQFLFNQLCRLLSRKFLGAPLWYFKTAVKIIILIWGHWVFLEHMLEERWRQCLELKIPKHMEKSLGSPSTVGSLWIRNGTVNVWDRSGHQWVLPAISELATLFPWRAVKVKSEGRKVICKYPFHLCGPKN